MMTPETTGGAFLAQALMNDVLHPLTGYNPQNDATDSPQTAVDPSQGRGGGSLRSEGDINKAEFLKVLNHKLNNYL